MKYKVLLTVLLLVCIITVIGFVYSDQYLDKNERRPFTSVKEANTYVEANFNEQEETLWISNALQDEMGLNMTIILEGILKKDYSPAGLNKRKDIEFISIKKGIK